MFIHKLYCKRDQNKKLKLISISTVTIAGLIPKENKYDERFHHGKTELFRETAGSHCSCKALVTHAYSVIK